MATRELRSLLDSQKSAEQQNLLIGEQKPRTTRPRGVIPVQKVTSGHSRKRSHEADEPVSLVMDNDTSNGMPAPILPIIEKHPILSVVEASVTPSSATMGVVSDTGPIVETPRKKARLSSRNNTAVPKSLDDELTIQTSGNVDSSPAMSTRCNRGRKKSVSGPLVSPKSLATGLTTPNTTPTQKMSRQGPLILKFPLKRDSMDAAVGGNTVSTNPGLLLSPLFADRPKGIIGECTDPARWAAALKQYQQSHLTDEEKQDPLGLPEVWARGRQALCETMPMFRAFQSAMHSEKGQIKGMMLDGFGHDRDQMSSKTIICRAGGGLKVNAEGEYVQMDSKTAHKQMKEFEFTAQLEQSVIFVLGQDARFTQFHLPERYVGLCHYKPVYCWYEKYDKATFGRLMFSALEPNEPVWFDTLGNEEPYKIGELPPPFKHTCSSCETEHQQVNVQGWMCLTPACKDFYLYSDGTVPVYKDLRYDPRFFTQHIKWSHSEPAFSIRPKISPDLLNNTPEAGGSFSASMGYACPKCGCCSERRRWSLLECSNPDCNWEFELVSPPVDPRFFVEWADPLREGPARPHIDFPRAGQKLNIQKEFSYQYHHNFSTTIIPLPGYTQEPENWIVVLSAIATVNRAPVTGTDALYTNVYEGGLLKLFARKGKAENKIAGENFSSMYFANFGEPYDFEVKVPTIPFKNAPEVIMNSLKRLDQGARIAHDLIRQHFGTKHVPDRKDFNELLALGYMVKDRIKWHDDGETGVGSTIGTLSLGAKSVMAVRVHKKFYHGVSKAGHFVDIKPTPGCQAYDWRMKNWAEHHHRVKTAKGDEKTRSQVTKAIGKELIAYKKSKEGLAADRRHVNPPPLVKIHLSHGDQVYMVGENFQKVFEHAVDNVSSTLARFSMTARTITNE